VVIGFRGERMPCSNLTHTGWCLGGAGSVSRDELKKMFATTRKALGQAPDAEEVQRRVDAVFGICDTNGDGFITEEGMP